MALLAYAVRRVTVPADAADVVAETFLVAWRRIAEVPAGPDARPWLFGVARKVLANVRRTDHRRSALADRLRAHVVEVVGPAELGGSAVEQALGRLRDADQEILRLSAWEQLEHDEIAVALGLSRGAVRVRLHRARRRLAETLRGIERSDDALPWTAARASGADARLVVARPVIEEGR
ncbi:RNA polymerase ECF family sigma subunit [Sediminihabitans luteus]|uniref:RNA polymerase ECF family sigma subunit n=2 Tax=Sediminihabitans luteus TaxID=1138585 RepID=A0A2M9CPL7_9CELL|nr:RNA polymerase ECF family sigma subunit [Sediminihabitans luteus]GII98251.1 hypothetical protein Slu03_06290 [Sediminihabitans luteus]